MKPEEKLLFETFISTHPDFLDIKTWTPGPEPPDILATNSLARLIGVELTEWLDERQTTPSISNQENQIKWLLALQSDHAPPRNFQYAQIWFRSRTRFSQREVPSFRREFYDLATHVDNNWERDMAGTPQKIWNDFNGYPTLGKHVFLVRFDNRASLKPTRWVVGTPKGGAYDPRWATEALLQRIEEKKRKSSYAKLKAEHGLAELVLLLHYGIRGLLHNLPFEGLNWKLEDSVSKARKNLSIDPGPFDRVFLYLAYNEGQLLTLYP